MKSKHFTTGYVYIYCLGLSALDTLTLSRSKEDFFNVEVFSFRVVGLFSYWLVVKNLAGLAERKGYSYKMAMVLGILGLPTLTGVCSLLILNIS
jgi:hypothetical protein